MGNGKRDAISARAIKRAGRLGKTTGGVNRGKIKV